MIALFPLFKHWNVPNLISSLALICGLLGVLNAMSYNIGWGFCFIIAAILQTFSSFYAIPQALYVLIVFPIVVSLLMASRLPYSKNGKLTLVLYLLFPLSFIVFIKDIV